MTMKFTNKTPLLTGSKVVAIKIEASDYEGPEQITPTGEVVNPVHVVSVEIEHPIPSGDQKSVDLWTEAEVDAICDSVATANDWATVLENKLQEWRDSPSGQKAQADAQVTRAQQEGTKVPDKFAF